MAWSDNIIPMVRLYINDTVEPYTYNNARLEQVIVLAAYNVLFDVQFEVNYTITFNPPNISPDPSNDSDFIVLVSLKSACMIISSEYKTKSASGIVVVDGPSRVDLGGVARSIKDIADNICKQYESSKNQYLMGNGIAGAAVTGPIFYESIAEIKGNING